MTGLFFRLLLKQTAPSSWKEDARIHKGLGWSTPRSGLSELDKNVNHGANDIPDPRAQGCMGIRVGGILDDYSI